MPEQQRPESLTVQMAAAGTPVTASPAERVIEGLCVPYGPVGNSSLGAITFSRGSLTFAEVGRVKLLLQHDPKVSLGYALSLEDRPDGLWGRFSVVESDEGDKALVEAAHGSRDGLSVGVMLDEEVLAEIVDKWIEGDSSATAASGRLLEVSQGLDPRLRRRPHPVLGRLGQVGPVRPRHPRRSSSAPPRPRRRPPRSPRRRTPCPRPRSPPRPRPRPRLRLLPPRPPPRPRRPTRRPPRPPSSRPRRRSTPSTATARPSCGTCGTPASTATVTPRTGSTGSTSAGWSRRSPRPVS